MIIQKIFYVKSCKAKRVTIPKGEEDLQPGDYVKITKIKPGDIREDGE